MHNTSNDTDVAMEVIQEEDTTLKDAAIEEVTFVTGHSYQKFEVCWVCKDAYSSQPTIQPCHCPTTTGLAHPTCLIKWMNTYCKGRCPRCAVMFQVRTERRPRTMWEPDPLLRERKTKYIVMVTLNLIVTIVCFASIGHLIQTTETQNRTPARIAVAGTIAVVFVVYLFYQSRVYVRVYERLKIYNNKVIEIYEWEEKNRENVDARHNLSSYIDHSDL